MGNQRVRVKNLIGLSKNRLTIIEELNVVKTENQGRNNRNLKTK